MQRVLRPSGIWALLATSLVSTPVFADEPAASDERAPSEEPATERPESVVPSAAAVAPAAEVAVPGPPVATPAAKPKVGDLSTHGYFRGGFGASNQRGRMTCFGLSTISGGLKSKYRLGNECEVWGELDLATVVHAGDDGLVGTLHFMPVVFIPTTYVGYSPSMTTSAQDQQGQPSTGATVAFPNLYADIKGIPWLFGGTAWAGSRYYKRESVYISDFFYWNPSGVGAGIEDITLGKIWTSAPPALSGLSLSYGAFAVDGQPRAIPYLPQTNALGIRNDLQLRGLRPYPSGELQVGFQYIANWSRTNNDDGDPDPTYGGWGVTVRYLQQLLGGTNILALQYGRGGGTGFGTLARFYYPDFSLKQDLSQSRIRVLDVLTIQPTDWLGTQIVGVYQRDDKGTGVSGAVDEWYSAGTRVSIALAKHAKFLGEAGYDRELKSNGAPPLWLAKFTGALAITSAKGFWARPELRLFYTYATWSEAAGRATIDSGRLYTDTYPTYLSGATFGLQTEAMW